MSDLNATRWMIKLKVAGGMANKKENRFVNIP
jgi:hypothetical protein